MNYKFRIPYDDSAKIASIFEVFGQHPFTRAKVVATDGLPQITSGDIIRWQSHGMIECLGRDKSRQGIKSSPLPPYLWRVSDRTVFALTRDIKKQPEGDL